MAKTLFYLLASRLQETYRDVVQVGAHAVRNSCQSFKNPDESKIFHGEAKLAKD